VRKWSQNGPLELQLINAPGCPNFLGQQERILNAKGSKRKGNEKKGEEKGKKRVWIGKWPS